MISIEPTRQILLSLISLFIALIWFELTPTDVWLQSFLYDSGRHEWLLNQPGDMAKFIFYDGIKILLVLVELILIVYLVFFRTVRIVYQYRHGLLVVILSLIIVPSVIGGIKATSNIACPKDITHFGGQIVYVKLFNHYSDENLPATKQKCFPAGHASGGFALMSLYYLFQAPRNRRAALTVSLVLGWVMGSYKMIIGDHFFSHTFVTMLLSWLFINIIVIIDILISNKTKTSATTRLSQQPTVGQLSAESITDR